MSLEKQVVDHICGNPECKVAEAGRCLEGLSLDTCPTYGREQTAAEKIVSEKTGPEVEKLIGLRPATQLKLNRASDLLGRHSGRVVAIVGPRDAGKTSLIASVFDLFQGGPVADLLFAESQTLHAFELACHDSRTVSRRNTPVQERTAHGEVNFYHLDTVNMQNADRVTLLLGDRAGEDYRTAANDLSQAGPFPEVARADTVTVLVDGGRLLDDKTRHNTRNEIKMMIRALVDGGFLKRTPRVVFALTKLDLIRASELKDRAFLDFDAVVGGASPILLPHVDSIESVHIAAASADTITPRGTGVTELLTNWVRPISRTKLAESAPKESNRAILNLKLPSKIQGAAK